MPPEVRGDVERLLREQVRTTGLELPLVEKDYALSYMLAGIGDVSKLYEIALFKGGTSLRKAYFPGYRFSEDLDYTVLGAIECEDLAALIKEAALRTNDRLNERGPFDVSVKHVPGTNPHARQQCQFKIAFRFPWMRSANCVLKLEMLPAPPEVVTGKARELDVIHSFDEPFSARSNCYQLEEIAAEKLRAFLQTTAKFDDPDRSWVRTRPRDLYDLSRLQRQTEHSIDHGRIRPFLEEKCPPYEVTFTGASDFLDRRVIDDIQRNWETSLGAFVRPLPTFSECLEDYRAFLSMVLP